MVFDGIFVLKFYLFDLLIIFNIVIGYGDGYIEINKVCYEYFVLVMFEGVVVLWDVLCFEDLMFEYFVCVFELGVEVVIFGMGNKLCFLYLWLMVLFIEKCIGVDVMDL